MQHHTTSDSSKLKKWLKVIAWVVGVSLLVFVGLFFFTFWLESKLERMVEAQSKGVYKLRLYGLSTSPFIGSLAVDSLELQPNYERWQELSKKRSSTPRTLLRLHTGPINLRKLSYVKALLKQKIQLDELEVAKLNMLLTVMRPDTTESHKPLHETTKGFLQGLAIGKIHVRDGQLGYRLQEAADTAFTVKHFNLQVLGYKLDSASFHAKERAYYAKKYMLAASNITYQLPDGLYSATTDTLQLDTQAERVLVKGLALKPTVEPAALARAKGKAVTYQEITVKEAALQGVAFGAHSRENEVRVRHVQLLNPSLTAFKDKQHFQDKGTKQLPHAMVQSIKTPFLLDTIALKHGYIRYAELVPQAQERGHITFHHLRALITNLSNMPEHISMEKPAVVQATTKVMDRAKLNVTIKLPLLNRNGYHTLEGEIGETNLQILNPILMPTTFMKITRGQVSSARFKAELTDARATGTMVVLYNNLEVELLKKGSGGDQGLGKKLISELADWIAIKDSNPAEGEQPRTGEIAFSHNRQKSVFNYWKSCLVSGFKSSIGLKSEIPKK
ncbi:AsmA family protein [Pontibacter mangrovi]|uniref:DUF748 domain-containing protein n=1 Tax=Pontibacter mangrovi TaxID=2589816 RepID=A0A501W4C7_9BACT|nr:hypothetical protein [Pontibacter mangrovi]TPE43150.1 hypothetical protein FJM65_13595 [Pontibacter mangrovi]